MQKDHFHTYEVLASQIGYPISTSTLGPSGLVLCDFIFTRFCEKPTPHLYTAAWLLMRLPIDLTLIAENRSRHLLEKIQALYHRPEGRCFTA